MGQLTPHVMGELIPIMEEFYGTMIHLWLPINSLSSYEEGDFFWSKERTFGEKVKRSNQWTLNTLRVKNRVSLWLVFESILKRS